MSDDDYAWECANWGTDAQWWDVAGHCGGCGLDTCHPGQRCTDDRDGTCTLCPERVAMLRAITRKANR